MDSLTSVTWYQILFWLIEVLQKVEQDRVASFVGYEDLRALFVFVAWNHISFKEVVPGVGLLKGTCTIEL